MKTFSQYLEEKKIMSAALAGIVGGVGLGAAGGMTRQAPVPVVQSQPVQQQTQPTT